MYYNRISFFGGSLMKTLGIKLADGSFYPVMEEGVAQYKQLILTTANNNQTKVMVDLYRSANCTMDDAEYVDSLQIDNLVEHPNGEVSIEFDVSLDENNQLTAHLIDEETGRRSDTELPLITRTLEERELTDEYAIKESENSKNNAKIAAGVAGVGLLAMANAINNQKNKTESEQTETQPQNENIENDDIIEEPTSISDDETSVDDTRIDSEPTLEDEFAFDDGEPISSDENQSDEANIFDDEKTSTTENSFADDEIEQNSQNSDNFNEDDIFADMDLDNLSENDTKSSDEATFKDDDTNSTEKNIFDESEENQTSTDETISNNDYIFDNSETNSDDNIFKDMNLDDISDAQNSDSNQTSDDDFDIPDFDETESEGTNPFEDDDISNDANKAAAGGISFTGLYDKETEEGNSEPTDEAEETRKKTKVPVIICIVCAIICIIATLLILFVIPSKINVLKKLANNQNQNTVVEKPVEKTEPEQIPEPIIEQKSEPEPIPEPVPQAKEDEIVVVEKAEEVIPEPPEPAPQKAENIVYKIKWGDTLWDIADTYYKNPWKYKYIARWNGIKNPDYIISGTQIIIPAE